MRFPSPALPALLSALAALAAQARVPGDIGAAGPRTLAVDTAAYVKVYYVSAAAPADDGDGSRARPWRSLSQAVRRVAAGSGQRAALLVAAGTYDDDTVVMGEHVDLLGGFSPESWQRDIFAHATILDGRHARRVVVGANHARLDGFVLTRGRAQGHGGAMLCDGTSPTITNNRFELSFTVAPAAFRHDRIHQSGSMGGALACLYESVPVVAHNLFRANHTEIGEGGALVVWGWHRLPGNPRATIEHNVFVGNVSGQADHHRTRSSSGGAVAFSHEASPLFRHNVVAQNRAMGRSDAGGVYCEFFSSPTIEHNWIVGNEGDDDGGGLYTMRQGEPLIRHNLFAGNWTTMGGIGGIRVSKEGRARVVDNHIVWNQSGGGLYMADGYLHLEGNLIADNRKGPGLRLQQNFPYFQPSRVAKNRFLRNEEGAVMIAKIAGAAPVQEGNEVKDGPPLAPAARWTITRAAFDPRRGQSTLQVAGGPAPAGSLAGATVWTGRRWGVVAGAGAGTLTIWGDLTQTGDDSALWLLPDYR